MLMLRLLTDLLSYRVNTIDGDSGRVRDACFDEDDWVVRYLVMEFGAWSANRNVLISPASVGRVDSLDEVLYLIISKARIDGSPEIDTDKPVSRPSEVELLGYYGYPALLEGLGHLG